MVFLALGVSTSGVVALAGRGAAVDGPRHENPPKAARAGDGAFVEVRPGRLSVVVEGRGRLEASENADVYCRVEGQTTILMMLPEGTRVRKGDLVCELDSAPLRDQLTNQVIALKGAEADYGVAKLAREVAEIAVTEYVDGVSPGDRLAASGEIALARSAIARAEERVKRTRAARERMDALLVHQGGVKTPADVVAGLDVDDRLEDTEQALVRERRALELAQAKREVLEKYTKARTVKQLRNEVEKARSLELARLAARDLERSKGQKLERQIANCRVVAPADGMLVRANDPNRPFGRQTPQIEEGATVRERQKLFSIPNLDAPLRVVVKVPEATVAQVRRGLAARVKIDAFPDETFPGTVGAVAPLPDPSNVFNADAKVYTTYLTLEKGRPGLRPGMTATIDILVADLDDVLRVPVHALIRYDGKDHVAVKEPGGAIDWREVTLGLADGKMVEVKEGLKPGEAVASDPTPLLSEEQKRKLARSLHRPAPQPKARGKGAGVLPALRDKLRAITPEDRAKLKDASPEERAAILKRAGLTDEEVRQIDPSRRSSDAPR